MAAKQFDHDIDGASVYQILGFRLQNVTDAEMSVLAGILGADNAGLTVWNTSQDASFIWTGSEFSGVGVEVQGDMRFAGLIDASVAIDNASQPQSVSPVAGHQYVVSVAGSLSPGSTGVSFSPSPDVEVGDHVLFVSSSEAYVLQRNDDEATETDLGNIRLATQAEVNAGQGTSKAVTPATLTGKLASDKVARVYFGSHDLGAGTTQITHGLGLQDQDAFTFNAMFGGSQRSFDVDSVDENTIEINTLIPRTGVKITVIGF